MKVKITLLLLLTAFLIHAQEKDKNQSFTGCPPQNKCFQEKFSKWFSGKVENPEQFKGQKATFEIMVDKKGKIKMLISIIADSKNLETALEKVLFDLPDLDPYLDNKGKPVSTTASISIQL